MLSWRVCFVINISSLVCFNCVGFDDSVSDYDSICLLQVSRLICTNSGDAILVLASNAINLLCFVQECLLCDINIWWKDLFVQHDDIQGITRLSSFYFYP